MVIAPTEDGKSLKVFCLDDVDGGNDKIVELCRAPYGKMLHGRTLEFQNDFRPSMRYLYVSFCVSILRRQRHEVPGWWKDRVSLAPQKVWASPGEYLRTSTIYKLARRIGHLGPDDAEDLSASSLIGDSPQPTTEEAEETHCTIISAGMAERGRRGVVEGIEYDSEDTGSGNEVDDEVEMYLREKVERDL